MFNIEKFIDGVKQKNPKIFAAEKIVITMHGFEEQLRYAYRRGYEDAEERHELKEDFKKKFGGNETLNTFNDIFHGKT